MNLLATILLLSAPAFQEKVTLKHAPQAGDRIERSSLSTVKVTLAVPGLEEPYVLEQKSTERRVIHILEVADGKATKVLYDVQEQVDEQKAPPAMEWKRQEKPLHGKRITVTLKDGVLAREGTEGLEEKDVADLTTLEDRTSIFFPARAVAVGESWEVPEEDVRRWMKNEQYASGRVTMKLLEIRDVDGVRCAVLRTTLDLTATETAGLSMKADGDLVVRLDRGYMVSLKLKGTATFAKKQGESTITGEGPIAIEMASKPELAGSAPAAPAAGPKDVVSLKSDPRKGDAIETASLFTMKMAIDVGEGAEKQTVEMQSKSTEKRTLHILEAADGKATKVLYDCREEIEEEKQPGAEDWTRKEQPLHGRKVTVFMRDGALAYEGADELDPSQLKDLTLDDKNAHLFPKKPVAVGDRWDVSDEDAKAFIQADPFDKARISMKLLEVKELDGHRCAVLGAKLELSGKDESDSNIVVKLEGKMVVRIDRGYLMSLSARGTMTITGNGYKGEGPVTLEMTAKVK
jgi:hypothetical protein